MSVTPEQEARDLIEAAGVEDAQAMTSGDLAGIANLIAKVHRVKALADAWSETPDYTASDYDRGRVDQRHDMTEELLAIVDD
jgi:hypothetical protein